MYIGPEFQLGQVYDGESEPGDSVVLYRPVYLCVQSAHPRIITNASSIDTKSPTSSRANDTPTSTSRTRINQVIQNQPVAQKPLKISTAVEVDVDTNSKANANANEVEVVAADINSKNAKKSVEC